MQKPRVLVVGDQGELTDRLRADYIVFVETDINKAAEIIRREWLHLCIVYLQQPTPTQQPGSATAVDQRVLEFAIKATDHPPKILVLSEPFDKISQIVHEALIGLERPAPALAVVAPSLNTGSIVDTVGLAFNKFWQVNSNLVIKPAHITYDLANYIMPGTDPGLWEPELDELIRTLFYKCKSIQIEALNDPKPNRGKLRTLWVKPASPMIPYEHPLLVKIGRKEAIEQLHTRYENYLFRLTQVRLAGYAKTHNFAALAYPAPGEEHKIYDIDFCRFYQTAAGRDADDIIGDAIDCFFKAAARPWNKQKGPPPQIKSLREHYLDRFNLRDRSAIESAVADLPDAGLRHRLLIKLGRKEINFQLSGAFEPYPNPVLDLYGDVKELKILDKSPESLCIGHCNLKGMNFCVDNDANVWIDGYDRLEWGPSIADVAGLEALLKFNCLQEESLEEIYHLERLILSPTSFDNSVFTYPFRSDKIKQVLKWIIHLRTTWARLYSSNIAEYYANLFFFTIRELIAEDTSEQQRIHALISSAMISHRLRVWPKVDWPGRKQIGL